MTKEQIEKLEDISDAYDFVKKYYPGFWDRVTDDDILSLLTLSHTLYKSEPQRLEATIRQRQTPTQ